MYYDGHRAVPLAHPDWTEMSTDLMTPHLVCHCKFDDNAG